MNFTDVVRFRIIEVKFFVNIWNLPTMKIYYNVKLTLRYESVGYETVIPIRLRCKIWGVERLTLDSPTREVRSQG